MDVPECPGCRELRARNTELEARVLALEGQVRDLLDKLRPPKPPRAVTPQPPAPAKTPTGRKPGGQPGHEPHLKRLAPADRVNHVIPIVPECCGAGREALPAAPGPTDPPPVRHQVAELPAVAAVITEYQGHARTCPQCGAVTRAAIPAELRAHSVGDRLTATLADLAGCHGVSKRGLEEVAAAVFDAPVALGTVANLEQRTSAALAAAHQQARAAVADAPVKHVDETGWKQAGKQRWLWVGATADVVAFLIHPRRNLAALTALLGRPSGILCSDRWRTYDDWPLDRRQVCWADLKRNWEKQVARGGRAKALGERWLAGHDRVFEVWHLFRGGGCTRDELGERLQPLIEDLGAVLGEGVRARDRRLARFCDRILDVYPAAWVFVFEPGVEPTNNHAERVQRRAVLWRRKSFGCHSAAGCRFVERILTVVQTLRLQGRGVLEYLTACLRTHRAGLPSPRLVAAG